MLGKTIAIVLGVFVLAMLFSLGKLWEFNDTGSILVIQSWGGHVSIYTDSGYQWQGWGKVTHYRKSFPFNFNPKEGGTPIKVRFSEGGHGDVAGSCLVNMPLDKEHILAIQRTFGSQEAVEKSLVRPTAERSMYLSGPHMTSSESFSARRADLISLFEDQAKFGIYQTSQVSKEITDPITGEKKWITAAEIRRDKEGNPLRQEESALQTFGLSMYSVAVVDIDYEKVVADQIAQQQTASTAVQIAKAQTVQARQDAETAEQKGKAEAVKARWAQEVIKATAVTRAEQDKAVAETKASQEFDVAKIAAERRLQVAEYDKKAAEQTKQEQILLGEGESQRKKLVMAADGALTQKLGALVDIAKVNANAVATVKGNLVPSTIIAGGDGKTGTPNTVQDLLSTMLVNSTKQLNLDMTLPGAQASAGSH